MEVHYRRAGGIFSGGGRRDCLFRELRRPFYALDEATGQLKRKFETAGERRYAGRHLHGLLPAGESMPHSWDYFLSSPAVWNGGVYFGSGDGLVYALDAASGKLKWRFATADVVHSSPGISDGTLYIGSWNTYLYALDAASGKEVWRCKTGDDGEIHNHVGIQASPAVADGSVYFSGVAIRMSTRWTPTRVNKSGFTLPRVPG